MTAEEAGESLERRLALFYEHTPHYASRGDIAFYVQEASSAGGPLLELGCGTGRILLAAARAGADMTGVDLSQPMLDILREKLEREDEEVRRRIRVIQADMSGFCLARHFSLITVPFRPLSHLLSTEAQLDCMCCMNRHLEMGGRLILDVFHIEPGAVHDAAFIQERLDFDQVPLPDGTTLRRTHRFAAFDRARQINQLELIYYVTHPDGRVERIVDGFPWRYFYRYEVTHLLARCGFEVVELYGDFDRSPFTDSSPDMIFIAEKQRETPPVSE